MKKQRLKRIYIRRRVLLILLPLLLLALFVLYRFINLNLWITRDAGILQPYTRVLIKDEFNVFESDPSPDPRVQLVEKALVKANAKDRIVLNLSRSNIRYNLLRNKAYVKVYLQTAIPRDRTKTTRIKFLNVLMKKGVLWRVQKTQDISIE